MLWNAVPGDWEDPDGWVERALAQVAARDWTLLVLHDVRDAAAPNAREFLDRVQATFRQDFPPACVPIVRGNAVGPLDTCSSGGIGLAAQEERQSHEVTLRRSGGDEGRGCELVLHDYFLAGHHGRAPRGRRTSPQG